MYASAVRVPCGFGASSRGMTLAKTTPAPQNARKRTPTPASTLCVARVENRTEMSTSSFRLRRRPCSTKLSCHHPRTTRANEAKEVERKSLLSTMRYGKADKRRSKKMSTLIMKAMESSSSMTEKKDEDFNDDNEEDPAGSSSSDI